MDVAQFHLDGNADAVEFCPHYSSPNVLAVSTYTLHEGDRASRTGSLSLFTVEAESRSLELSHRVDTAGIFDIKWSPPWGGGFAGPPMLAQADADGFLRVHRLEEEEEGGLSLKEIASKKISSSMCLYLDWDPTATYISVGLSDGSAAITSFRESQLVVQREWKAHEFELWTTAFDADRPEMVYTGSDDNAFCGWDLRLDEDHMVFRNSRAHTMGVCCVASGHRSDYPYTVLTGSYDESLRVWDLRSISRPVMKASLGLGGGVWRIKNNPYVSGIVLAACMHNGFAIVNVGGNEVEVVETYRKHDSLAYGADWHRGLPVRDGKTNRSLVATCSFYDKLLKVWIPKSEF